MNAATHIGVYTAADSTTTSGTERIRIDSSGRLFVGTTTPVLNDGGFNEIVLAGKSEGAGIHLADDNNNVQAGMFTSDSGSGAFYIRTITNNPMAFRTNNLERLRITSDGKIGIGTTTPAAELEVVGNAKITGSQIDFTALPTSDPNVAGRLWRDGTDLKVSVG